MLTGKYNWGDNPPKGSRGAAGERTLKQLLSNEGHFRIVEQLKPLAEARGWSLTQFAMSWVLSRPGISSAILGASRPEQVLDATKHSESYLTQEELNEIDRICEITI